MLQRIFLGTLPVCLALSLVPYQNVDCCEKKATLCQEVAAPERPRVLQVLRKGMTLPQVMAILGLPRGPTNQNILVFDLYGGGILMHSGRIVEWWFENWLIQIVFDDNGRAVFVRCLEVYQIPQGDDEILH